MTASILLVDDDRFILAHLDRILQEQGCHCVQAATAVDAWAALDAGSFDLLILDIGLPDVDGLTLCRKIRVRHTMPIIMLTARGAIGDKVVGLELGADDYLTKPFDPAELVSRVRAHIRRRTEYGGADPSQASVTVGDLTIDPERREVRRGKAHIDLTPTEFALLLALARRHDRAVARDWLFEHVWGWESEPSGQTLAVAIRRLRCKIEPDPGRPTYIQTVRGYGYKLSIVDRLTSPDCS